MIERIDTTTPQIIQDLLIFPYSYFSNKFKSSTMTLLDIACGNNIQYDILSSNFNSIISLDYNANGDNIKFGDILNIPLEDNSVDITFSFETIEHVADHDRVLSELKRVTKKILIIGSVNKTGPDYIDNVEIFKGDRNKYHIKEIGSNDWIRFFKGATILQSLYNNQTFTMTSDISDSGYCNYAIYEL